jgi:hypothetical protein
MERTVVTHRPFLLLSVALSFAGSIINRRTIRNGCRLGLATPPSHLDRGAARDGVPDERACPPGRGGRGQAGARPYSGMFPWRPRPGVACAKAVASW